jgi:hypothetical protein
MFFRGRMSVAPIRPWNQLMTMATYPAPVSARFVIASTASGPWNASDHHPLVNVMPSWIWLGSGGS